MSLFSTLLAIASTAILVALILYVLFGQITVRKLRNNPETKDKLGIEFISGGDIINVAQALALPTFIARKLKDSPLSALHANYDVLKKHTNKFDQILGTIFYVLLMSSSLSLAFLMLLNTLGVLE
ncbi:MAG: hypothetical protein GY737_18590 [Desulfobacteraceae bacterium]|nr:hypothetical protein [Desulfobacteraceae bacterium]